MKHINREDLQSLVQRLEILKRWAVMESGRDSAARAQSNVHSRQSPDANAGPAVDGLAAVKVRRPSLADIDKALQRIARGQYGLCGDCETVIARERMLIEPAAIRCNSCHRKNLTQNERHQ